MVTKSKRAAAIVGSWRDMELFSPQTLPKLVGTVEEPVVRWTPPHTGQAVIPPLPWEPGGLTHRAPTRSPRLRWQHEVFVGVYQLEDVQKKLEDVFDPHTDAYSERPSGQSAVCGFLVDHHGQYLQDSLVISTCAWALGQCMHLRQVPQPGWHTKFDEYSTTVQLAFEEYLVEQNMLRPTRISDNEEVPSSTDAVVKTVKTAVTNAAQEAVAPGASAVVPAARALAAAVRASRAASDPIEDGPLCEADQDVEDWESASQAPIQALTATEVGGILKKILQGTHLDGTGLVEVMCWVRCKQISEDRTDVVGDFDFLNSFILADLNAVTDALNDDDPGAALGAYLTGASPSIQAQRIDLEASAEALASVVVPEALPMGRWPSNPAHSLATTQQAAVNIAVKAASGDSAPVMGVNGPPGTGKSTLLRDVMAGLLTERADRIAALDRPATAFEPESEDITWQDKYPRVLPKLVEDLAGFEMIVASENNNAVQNITDELPQLSSLHGSFMDEGGAAPNVYFRDIATRVSRALTKNDRAQAWGLVCARLGNSKNRRAFKDALWKDTPKGQTQPDDLCKFFMDGPHRARRPWRECVNDYNLAKNRVAALVEQAQMAAARPPQLQAHRADAKELAQALKRALQAWHQAQTHRDEAQERAAAATHEQHKWRERRDDHSAQRPPWHRILFTLGRAYREWDDHLTELLTAVRHADEVADHTESVARSATAAVLAAHDHVQALRSQRDHAQRCIHDLEALIAQDKKRYGSAYPDQEWFDDRAYRHLHTPWSTPELNEARSAVFLAAMQLHYDLLDHNHGRLRRGFRAALAVITGESRPNSDAVVHAWRLFFLVVPMVSTTFASFARCFKGLGPESLGWLFVDEAGQAKPQSPVGGLWRTRRALIVGDPQQLTPIVTIPIKAQTMIMDEHQAPLWSLPANTSAQGLADAATRCGTLREDSHGTTWVGTPLVVHRRCDDPMFTISNTIAYASAMIHGTAPSTPEKQPALRLHPSCWMHVAAGTSQGHYLPADFQLVKRLIHRILNESHGTLTAKDIITISPFRAMANKLADLQHSFPGIRAGTVHTAQGQEAPIVFLVLGGDPERDGAKTWATSTPNLINVAVSRAQRRLFVIGDHQLWSPHPNIDTAAMLLPQVSPDEFGSSLFIEQHEEPSGAADSFGISHYADNDDPFIAAAAGVAHVATLQ